MTALVELNTGSALEAALEYARRGWPVLPLHYPVENDEKVVCSCGLASCDNLGKHPRTSSGVKEATTDSAKIKEYWKRWPHANVGIATGLTFLVIDIDAKEDLDAQRKGEIVGLGNLPEIFALEPLLHKTIAVQTGGSGRHLYGAIPPSAGKVPNRVGIWKGVDVRADGGYVVAPPSLHGSLRRYQWLPDQDAMCTLSDAFIERIKKPSGVAVSKDALSNVVIPQGQRNASLFRIAASRSSRGYQQDETLGFLLRVNHERCDPPLTSEEVTRIVESAYTYPPSFQQTDLGNARALAHWFGRDVRWTGGLGWLEWESGKWEEVSDVHMLTYAHTLTGMLETIAKDKDNETLQKWSHASQSSNRLEAAVKQFKPLVEVKTDLFDRNHMLLPCLNGTVDLSSNGRFRISSREDLMTKRIPVIFDSKAACPRWENALSLWMGGDDALVDYVQRMVGYCLTGDTRHQAFFILYGTGANGKSTFIRTLLALLGSFGITVSSDLLMRNPRISLEPERARLLGARLAVCSESSEGGKMDAEVIKNLTGGEPITAKKLYKDPISFAPTHKIILHTNHKPKASSYDNALWRRIIPVPFTVVIPQEQQNSLLPWQLLDELPGILNWAIRGCHDEKQRGHSVMDLPRAVAEAKEEYQAENDVIREFLEETCVKTESRTDRLFARELHTRYTEWCRRHRRGAPLEYKRFNKEMREREGFASNEMLVHNLAVWTNLKFQRTSDTTDVTQVDLERA